MLIQWSPELDMNWTDLWSDIALSIRGKQKYILKEKLS